MTEEFDEIGLALDVVARAGCSRRLVCGDDVRAIGDRQGAALPATHHGSARREAEAAGRAGDESIERWPRRSIQSDDAQSGARPTPVRPVPLSALGNLGSDKTQRV